MKNEIAQDRTFDLNSNDFFGYYITTRNSEFQDLIEFARQLGSELSVIIEEE